MKKEHIGGLVVIIIIVLLIFATLNYNKIVEARARAKAKKESENSDYNFHKNVNPASTLDDGTLNSIVQNLRDAYEMHWYTMVSNANVSQLSAAAHQVLNQAQWSQVVDAYASATGQDLIEDVKIITDHSLPLIGSDHLVENIKPILDYIKTLPSA
jgi:hypothetical protein